jgi:anti-anti-sigma factor
MMEQERVRENRLRRMAARQGLRLLKSRRRDPYASGYGTYVLVPAAASRSIPADAQFGCDLDEIEQQLKTTTAGEAIEQTVGDVRITQGAEVRIVDAGDPHSANLAASVRDVDGHAEVVLTGELDLLTAPMLRAHLHALIRDGHRQVRVNASGLTFLDAAGIGSLIEAQRQLRALNGDLRLHNVHGLPLRTLTICHLVTAMTSSAEASPVPARAATS